ncbi:MAG: hypothetical protein C4549_05530 [Deltaproteobacteria bacterium]|jgi:hypothetical protein|nr:MAG: hypothetical protein C4549_05530 [Deltaproteobacteria bacterium]
MPKAGHKPPGIERWRQAPEGERYAIRDELGLSSAEIAFSFPISQVLPFIIELTMQKSEELHINEQTI